MRGSDFQDALRAEPFRPFTVHMPSGKIIEITNPGLAMVNETGRTALVFKPRGEGWHAIDLTLVERIEFGDEGPPTRTNGPRRR